MHLRWLDEEEQGKLSFAMKLSPRTIKKLASLGLVEIAESRGYETWNLTPLGRKIARDSPGFYR